MEKRFLKVREVREIYRRFWQFENTREIARSHAVSKSYVYKIGTGQRHAGITGQLEQRRRRKRECLPDDLEALYERYSLRTIAFEFDVGLSTVRRELIARGAILRSQQSPEAKRLRVENRRGYYELN